MKENRIAAWLTRLSTLTAPLNEAELADKLRAYTPMLADRFDAEAFTQRSLDHVATRAKFFPAYAELVEALGAWWRDARQEKPPRITSDAPDAIARRAEEAERAEWNSPGVAIAAIESVQADLEADLPLALNAARVLRITLDRYAPQHVPAIDALIQTHSAREHHAPKPVAAERPKHEWKAAAVTPDQLAAIRAQSRIKVGAFA